MKNFPILQKGDKATAKDANSIYQEVLNVVKSEGLTPAPYNPDADDQNTTQLGEAIELKIDKKIADIPPTDLSNYPTIAEVDAKDATTLSAANAYTDALMETIVGTFTPKPNIEVIFSNIIQQGNFVSMFIGVKALAITGQLGVVSGVHVPPTTIFVMGRVFAGTSTSGEINTPAGFNTGGLSLADTQLNIGAEYRILINYHSGVV